MTVMPAAAGFVGVTKWYEESRMAPGPVPWPFMLKMPGANGARFTVCGALVGPGRAPGPVPRAFMLKMPGGNGARFPVCGALVWPARVAVTAGGCPASSHGICRFTWPLEAAMDSIVDSSAEAFHTSNFAR